MIIKSAYQKETNLFQSDEVIALWYAHLKDLDYQMLQVGLSAYVETNKWSPSIAELREMCTKICDGTPDDWSEAWEKVLYAISVYGRDNKADAMEYFDEVTRTVVARIGWFNLCTSEDISIERANFRQIFQTVKQKRIHDNQLHPGIRKVIEATKETNRKLLEVKHEEKSYDIQPNNTEFNRSDRIRELINKTKQQLKGGEFYADGQKAISTKLERDRI